MLLAAVFSPFENRNSKIENSPGTITGAGYGGTNAVAEEVRQVFIPPANETLGSNTNGAITGNTRWAYTINSTDQLTSVLENNPPAGVQALKVDFKYDWLGRLIERKATRAGAAVKRTTFLYDGWRPVRETEFDSTGRLAAQRVYTWGPNGKGDLDGESAVGGLIEVMEIRGSATTKSLAVEDGLGNVSGLVDEAGGTLVASYAYGPYGEALAATGVRASGCPLRYQGRLWDEDLQLYWWNHRWYDPATRTFLSRDPMRELGGMNGYSLASNQPFNLMDPMGGQAVSRGTYDPLRITPAPRGASGLELMLPGLTGRDDLIPVAREGGLYAAYGILGTAPAVVGHPKVQGPIRMLGGGLEMFGGGYYTAQTGGLGGALGGGLLVANGADNFWAGWQMTITGQYQQAVLEGILTDQFGPGWGTGAYAVTQLGMGGVPWAASRIPSLTLRAPGIGGSPLNALLIQAQLRQSALAQLRPPQIAVIGSLSDTAPFIGRPGFNVLNVADDAYRSMSVAEFDLINTQWINTAVGRGDTFWAVTDPLHHAAYLEAIRPGLSLQSRYLNLELPMLQEAGIIPTPSFSLNPALTVP